MQRKIKGLIDLRKIKWKKHALKRMFERNIRRQDVFLALDVFEIIELHELKRPLQSCLVLGYYKKVKPLHIMVAVDELNDVLWIVTVYEPSLDEWSSDFKIRRET